MVRERHHRFEGQVLVLMAITMVVMLGFTAMAVDVGHLLGARRTAQNAADAAALAGARLLMAGRSDPEIQAAVADYANRNLTDSVRITASDVRIDRTAKTVRVELTTDVERFFLGAVYTGDWLASAQAVAKVGAEPGDYALLALDEDNPTAINLIGNVDIHVVGGGAMSNGGMRCVGNGSLHADSTVDAHLVPGFSQTGNCQFQGAQGRNGGMPVVEDPLRNMPAPPRPTVPAQVNPAVVNPPYPCDNQAPWVFSPGRYRQNVTCSGNDNLTFQAGTYRFERAVSYSGNGTVTLNSGFYQFDSGFSVSGNATVVLHPGTYVFRGGAFSITGNASVRLLSGQYNFFFINSSFLNTGNLQFSGTSPGQISFYMQNSDFATTGNSDTTLFPGIYYFDGGTFRLIGNQTIVGQDVLFYLANGARMDVVGNTSYRLAGSTTPLYPGMQPGLTIFQERGNTSTFRMVGNSGAFIQGIVYLPDAPLELSGNASGTWAEGQLIVDQLRNNGNTDAEVRYRQYVNIDLPAVWLIE
ncbi:pilus assembly protein TadG-related protein [Thermomicrobiaceae bacterium CFH 74404]|uniref:Pilus assembly protein TadG-related protein n=1 Tax=Thermalbibacter longus TaxID=2951981 RepID=A0AA42BA99_9BACT|nr:pilus assembly protein TadG-related protein [Thermalbibacter longus]MCM8749611.1 pilus assembly protein TadG-related protein [Thermalbibacter longus]